MKATTLITRNEFEHGGATGEAPVKLDHYFVYHDDGEFEEIGPATDLYFTPNKVYVLLPGKPPASYDRDDIYLITRKETPAPPQD